MRPGRSSSRALSQHFKISVVRKVCRWYKSLCHLGPPWGTDQAHEDMHLPVMPAACASSLRYLRCLHKSLLVHTSWAQGACIICLWICRCPRDNMVHDVILDDGIGLTLKLVHMWGCCRNHSALPESRPKWQLQHSLQLRTVWHWKDVHDCCLLRRSPEGAAGCL